MSYTSNYFKIYIWRFIGYVAAFASVALVTPRISSSAGLFGIFSFCISLNIFFQYADLGFLNAAQKYASEFFGRKDIKGEIEVTGFSCFIFSIFMIPVCLGMLWLACHPASVIKGLKTGEELRLASGLLWCLFLFAPVMIMQRMVQVVFSVRLEDYYIQRIGIIVSILRIASVYYFFGGGRYMMLEWYIFYNLLTLVSFVVIISIARKKYKYDFKLFLRSFRYSRDLYKKTSKLAYNSLFLSISWILFYEIDVVYIGYFIGKEGVAYYALGGTVLSFLRDVYGAFYYPFLVRFNHFIGTGETGSLRNMYHTLLKVGVALFIIPITAFILLMRPIIFAWVGAKYDISIGLSQILIASSYFGFLTYPANAYLTATELLKKLYVSATIVPIVYFIGIFTTQHFLGIYAYALFKGVAIYVNVFILFGYTLQYLEISAGTFFNRYIKPILPALFTVLALGYLLLRVLPLYKGTVYFCVIGCITGLVNLVGFAVYYWRDAYFREFATQTIDRIRKKK